jgi:hypothetical protein
VKINTDNLLDLQLDWAVAQTQWRGEEQDRANGTIELAHICQYSRNWTYGGPIAEEAKIGCIPAGDHWEAGKDYDELSIHPWEGPTELVAKMRCYVGKVLGHEIDVPEELIT